MAKASDQKFGVATTEEMQAAINASGYLLEGRIARMMAARGFFVEPNYFISDPANADKAVEIDVVGRYLEWISKDNEDAVYASVLVECKNNSQPFAFFVQRQQLNELNENRIHYGGFPAFSMDQNINIQFPLHKLLEMKNWHHYCIAKEVATQFCTFERSDSNKAFKAGPHDNYSRSFSKLAVVAASDSADGYDLNRQSIQVQLTYPVVVFHGPIYRVEDDNGDAKLESVDRLQLHHATTVNGRVIQVQIDVVTESRFSNLMEDILEELKTFRDKINTMYPKLLRSAIDQKRLASERAARKIFSQLNT